MIYLCNAVVLIIDSLNQIPDGAGDQFNNLSNRKKEDIIKTIKNPIYLNLIEPGQRCEVRSDTRYIITIKRWQQIPFCKAHLLQDLKSCRVPPQSILGHIYCHTYCYMTHAAGQPGLSHASTPTAMWMIVIRPVKGWRQEGDWYFKKVLKKVKFKH